MYPGDIIALASDGINSLNGTELRQSLTFNPETNTKNSPAEEVLASVINKQFKNQDNTTIIVIQQ